MSFVQSQNNLILLICGYLRENEDELNLYMIIPTGIDKIMHDLYPVLLFKFGDFRDGAFQLSQEETVIKGKMPPSYDDDGDVFYGDSCDGFLIYADLQQFNDIGLINGIHVWSIRKLTKWSSCFASIGVTTDKSVKLVNEWRHDGNSRDHWIDKSGSFNSFFTGCGQWETNETITVKLDCNDWTATYYKDEKEIKKDEIEADKSYYFTMLCCGLAESTHFQVVESPFVL